VTWSLIEEENARALLCEWREIDGPPVLPPATKGFGSMLLNRVLSQQIRAEVDAEFDPQGFHLRMKVPLEIAS
jgi:two-component sensor histidine kinase